MKILRFFVVAAVFLLAPWLSRAADAPTPQPTPGATPTPEASSAPSDADKEKAAAVVVYDKNNPNKVAVKETATTEFIEHMVDDVLERFDVPADQNTPTRYAISIAILVVTFLLRQVVVSILFALLGKLAKRTETTLDDKLFVALRAPVATLVVVIGGIGALKALKLSPSVDAALIYLYTVVLGAVVFWILFRAFSTLLDHLHEAAATRQMGVAAFMPWIKKTLIVFFIIIGGLTIAQSLGADVKTFMAGLGIGGLAFALAAQDTIANVFGSVVVAVDQPFKIGETVQIGANTGTVEDIGLRSTKLRKVDKSLVIIPNKTVAAEAITNLSRFTQRRVEQTLGITYDATASQMEALVESIRTIITSEEGVDKSSVSVQFTNFGASSLDVAVIYVTRMSDNNEALRIRQRINLNVMRELESKGLSFAFPTQTLHVQSLPKAPAQTPPTAQA